MRIDPNISSAANNMVDGAAGKNPASAPNRTQDAQSASGASEIDPGFGKINSLKAELEKMPDIRQDLVDSLRQRIGNGSYNVSSDQIADAMIKDIGVSK